MKKIIVKELQSYSFKQFIEWFNYDEKKCKTIIDSLILMNVLKKLNNSEGKQALEELLEVENFEDIENIINKGMYSFKYVGMITVGNICFFIYPKYFSNPEKDANLKNKSGEKFKKFKTILSTIRKYNAKEQLQNINGIDEISEFNLLSFTLEMIDDYIKSGLYSNNKMIIEENGNGEILWEKTISEQNMYLSNGNPVYLDLYTVNNVIDESNIFRRIHSCILSRSCETLSEILDILDFPIINISSEQIEDFGDEEYLSYIIKQEYTQQFVTTRQKNLKNMLIYINREKVHNAQEEISFVGTNSFNLVWENVCSCVMDNCLDKTLENLELKPYDNISEKSKLIELIPKPKWEHLQSGNIHSSKKTLIPDIVSIKDKEILIYDAKYYRTVLNEKKVEHQPGVGDVTKQYLYELAYKKLADENNCTITKNAFLMPVDDTILSEEELKREEKIIGKVSMDLFRMHTGIEFNDIDVIQKPCDVMFEKYLNKM